jgi:hypothetical protein
MVRLAEPGFQIAIRAADIVFGADVLDVTRRSLFFGEATLERIVATGRSERALIVIVLIDDIGALAAACVALKGSCCHGGDGDEPGMIEPSRN